MRPLRLLLYALLLIPLEGCSLQEIVSKTKFGPEFRHDGGSQTNTTRWMSQQGFQFKFDKGISNTLTYRRRDVSNGDGDWDDGVWMEFAFPIWKAPKKPNSNEQKLEILEQRLAELEAQTSTGVPQ